MMIGAWYSPGGECRFTVWAPGRERMSLQLVEQGGRTLPLEDESEGYWSISVKGVRPGDRYWYVRGDGRQRPDPASFFQPEGVHGPSAIVDHAEHAWGDKEWAGVPWEKMIIYELHVGAFTTEGTFAAAATRLDELVSLGVTAVELMPVAQFPGERNWGYDGAYPYAVQSSYGGCGGLKGLVDACHRRGLAVLLDVVYNHLGPEGNYLGEYGPYFTDRYRTPWGGAINFDGPYSDGVRNFFIENARYWFETFHLDGLRLDAIHGIYDMGATHFLRELGEEVEGLSRRAERKLYLIAESDLNDPRVIRPPEIGGYGIDAQWCDDFHHCLHTLLTGEHKGYYADYGRIDDLKRCLEEGFVLSGHYSAYRKRRHGAPAQDRPACQFVVFSQSHDQVGNRMCGERLSELIDFEGLKLAAGSVMVAPSVPLLFMGEEYGEEAPFLYFVDHGDENLRQAVREGRKQEFNSFGWAGEPPDPSAQETFLNSKLRWEKRAQGRGEVLVGYYQELIRLRKTIPALARGDNRRGFSAACHEAEKVLLLQRIHEASRVLVLMNFERSEQVLLGEVPAGRWKKVLDSAEPKWLGPGASLPERITEASRLGLPALSLAVFQGEEGL